MPFITCFSPALDHLIALRKSVSRKTKDLEGEVREAERSCEGRLREIDGGFEVSDRLQRDEDILLTLEEPDHLDHRKFLHRAGNEDHRRRPNSGQDW